MISETDYVPSIDRMVFNDELGSTGRPFYRVPEKKAALSHRNPSAERTSRNSCSAHTRVVTAHAQGFFFYHFVPP